MDKLETSDESTGPRHAKLKLSLPPLLLLAFLLLFTATLFHYRGKSSEEPMPLVIFIIGFFVAMFGAFYDFGAKGYVLKIFEHGVPLKENDVRYINKQQLIMTSIYIGISGLYFLSALLLYYYVP
ncbi:MAG: hypothetical protein LVQ96_03870 [Thermoplasmatales archaeon]|nr:hypothetical protein [Thermoplasmatales archaeon]MCW6170290.1 hypothetical protein [Thermoplasmatales archaeon]